MSNAAVEFKSPFEVVCPTTDEAAWLEARRLGLGATDMSVVLGMNPWKSALQLYAEKVGAVASEDLSDVEAVTWGKVLEPVVGAQYAVRTGRTYEPARELIRSIEHPWALCSLDGWTDAPGNRGTWPLEIKTTSAFRAEDWSDGPPEHYRVQIQHQMLVTGAHQVTIACLLGGQRLVWCDVERDERMIRKLVCQGALFWERIQQRTPPEPDGSESARNALHQLFPSEQEGREIELPMAIAEVIDEWRMAKEEEKAAKERARQAENTIKATMGDAERAYLPGGDAVSWVAQTKKEHVVKESTSRVLRYHTNKVRK